MELFYSIGRLEVNLNLLTDILMTIKEWQYTYTSIFTFCHNLVILICFDWKQMYEPFMKFSSAPLSSAIFLNVCLSSTATHLHHLSLHIHNHLMRAIFFYRTTVAIFTGVMSVCVAQRIRRLKFTLVETTPTLQAGKYRSDPLARWHPDFYPPLIA